MGVITISKKKKKQKEITKALNAVISNQALIYLRLTQIKDELKEGKLKEG